MKEVILKDIKGANLGANVFVECDEFIAEGDFYIEDNVRISAKRIYLGNNSKIEKDTKICGLSGDMESFYMGDESLIGFNSQVMVSEFSMGDYSRIFSASLCSGYKPMTIGHNCWIGQSSILNSADTLTIGNNVRMGSVQIWTHVASGELLEGCRFYSVKPVTIEDNVWLMGFGHTVSPGVTIKRNTIVMSGSVVSKSTEEFHVYSGVPAVDITDKLKGWDTPTPDEKFEMLKKFVGEFLEANPQYTGRVFCPGDAEKLNEAISNTGPVLVFLKQIDGRERFENYPHTFFDLHTKHYTKKRTTIEVDWMKFSIGYRARFIPYDEGDKWK